MCENRQGLVLARRAFRSFRFSAQAGSSSAYTRHAGLESALAFIQRERERERGIKRRGASRRESARGQTARELLRETPPLAPPLPLPGPPRASSPRSDPRWWVSGLYRLPLFRSCYSPRSPPHFFFCAIFRYLNRPVRESPPPMFSYLFTVPICGVNSSSQMCELPESDPFFFKR